MNVERNYPSVTGNIVSVVPEIIIQATKGPYPKTAVVDTGSAVVDTGSSIFCCLTEFQGSSLLSLSYESRTCSPRTPAHSHFAHHLQLSKSITSGSPSVGTATLTTRADPYVRVVSESESFVRLSL